ncbi:putative transposase [Burkholderia cepacia]|nr:putative transposase [Burkholderia cepacia]
MNGNASSHDTPAGAVHTINWRQHFGGLEAADVKRLEQLEHENARLKKMLAERDLERKRVPSTVSTM